MDNLSMGKKNTYKPRQSICNPPFYIHHLWPNSPRCWLSAEGCKDSSIQWGTGLDPLCSRFLKKVVWNDRKGLGFNSLSPCWISVLSVVEHWTNHLILSLGISCIKWEQEQQAWRVVNASVAFIPWHFDFFIILSWSFLKSRPVFYPSLILNAQQMEDTQ